ncbi:MAG: hypothetical protein K2X87_08145 [Gemmataceae bacterium]|nr:hypothetical protein [Gemmataceae bacterium]
MAKRTDPTITGWPNLQDAERHDLRRSSVRLQGTLAAVERALPAAPPHDIPEGSLDQVMVASPPAAAAFLVRCLARVGNLALPHPALAPGVRRALMVGLVACRVGSELLWRVPEAEWAEGVETLRRLVLETPDPAVEGGPAQAALVAADLLGAMADPRALPPGFACRRAVEHVVAAFRAGGPADSADADCERVEAALGGDLDVLFTHAEDQASTDPGATGPFGPLWPMGAPLGSGAVTTAAPSSLLPKLTDVRGSPTLAWMAAELSKGQSLTDEGQPDPELLQLPRRLPWLDGLKVLRARVVAATEPFRGELIELLSAARGQSFHEENGAVADEINVLLGLLGLQFRDPDQPDRAAYLRCKNVPGTRGGAFELRTQAEGKQKILYSRISLPDRLAIDRNPQVTGENEKSD